jgi:hypothetical protein
MTKPALIKLADARRLAKVAKLEGVAVSIKMDGREITIFPDIHWARDTETVDESKDIKL